MAIRSYKDTAPVYEKLGDVYRAQSRDEEAIAYYRQALDVDSVDATARDKLGESYLTLGDEKKAVEQFKYASDIAPDNIDAQYRLAEHYEDIREWDKAERVYLIILSMKPEEGKAHRQIALIYERNEKYGLALYHWKKYSEINPKDQEAIEHIQAIRKPLLSKKQIDQLAAEKKMKDSSSPKVTPTISAPVVGNSTDANTANPGDAASSAPPPLPAANESVAPAVESQAVAAPMDNGASSAAGASAAPPASAPAAVAPVDNGNSNAPAVSAVAPSSDASAGLVPVGDMATPTPSQGNVPTLPN
jgi:hypothetical protein